MTHRVIVVGGAGGFGHRLVQGLITTSEMHVIVAGRNRERAAAVASRFPSDRASSVAFDATRVTADELRACGAFALVDAAGPYQGGDYRLAKAAIAAGLHYVDLADARDFVAGFAVLDEVARAAGVVALTGASSTPALSHAVLERLTAGWQQIDRIEIGISPGNRAAPRGLSVIQSILSYAGRPVRVFTGGEWVTRPGWGMTSRREMPGLGWRWLSLCETPDLDLLPARFRPCHSAIFRAGVELWVMHLGLLWASLLVRFGLVRSLVPLARPMRRVSEWLARFGSDRGGMIVEVVGENSGGQPEWALWSLVAANGEGPFVPTLPALAALRAIIAGRLPAGARPCVGVLDLAEIEREFAPYHITTDILT